MPENPVKAIDIMVKAVRRGEISEHSLNVRVRKMLELKESLGILTDAGYVEPAGLYEDLTSAQYRSLVTELSFKSMTLLKNENNIVPFVNKSDISTGYISVGGDDNGKLLAELMLSYEYCDTIVLRKEQLSVDTLSSALKTISSNDRIVIAVHDTDARPQKEFGIDPEYYSLLTSFAEGKEVVFLYFGNPLALSLIDEYDSFSAILIAYQNTFFNNLAAANILYGASGAGGSLPVGTADYNSGMSITSEGGLRQGFRLPYPLPDGYDKLISGIDSLILSDIDTDRYSMAQLILMDNGDIIHKATYGETETSVSFDVGRIEGIMALIPSILKLRETGALSFEEVYDGNLVSDYLMNRVSENGVISDEPLDFRYNEMILKDIIALKSNVDYRSFAKNEFWDKMGIYNVDYSSDGNMLTDANEVSKLVYMILNEGKYGGIELLDAESSDFASLLLHYYSRESNGGMVWTDKENKRAVIFLNNGTHDVDDDSILTPDVIRRLYLKYWGKGESLSPGE
jgi:hypothetical protein